jgi:hypothetical protein
LRRSPPSELPRHFPYRRKVETPGHIQPGAVNPPSYKMIIGNREPEDYL